MRKLAIASVAVLMLGSSAALAQPYGNRYYGYQPAQPARSCAYQDRAYDAAMYRAGRMDQILNCIRDPATNRIISQDEYLARYPWSDTRQWSYDPGSDLWGDHTREVGTQYSQPYNPSAPNFQPQYYDYGGYNGGYNGAYNGGYDRQYSQNYRHRR